MADPQVLIVGAGPTGLVLALWLTKQGVSVRILDETAEPGTTSRALAVHARTLELYKQLDLADKVAERGYAVPALRLWLGGHEAARVSFKEIVSDLTPYPFMHMFPQDEHERLLVDRLAELGVQVERLTELLSYEETGGGITARLKGPDGQETAVQAAFIAGCDGARSKVRQIMDSGFPGGTYPQVLYVADVTGSGAAFNGDLNIDLDTSDFLAIFPMAHAGRVRMIGSVRQDHGQDLGTLTFDDISGRAVQTLGLKVDKVNWFSVYHAHHRVTDHFREGRAFLLGDAAHIHTPVGGQGMNTGIGDAINLAWKLKAVLAGRAPDSLLDTFQAERRAFARRLVQTTDRWFTLAASEGHLAEIMRTRVAPVILPQVVKFEPAREFMFRTISQITLNYRGKGLDEGHAGPVHGGDRMPWVKIGDSDNYAALSDIGWQVHVYGTVDPALSRWCEDHKIPLHAYAWEAAFEEAGLRRDALYLVRPDAYVAVAQSGQGRETLDQYLAKTQIKP